MPNIQGRELSRAELLARVGHMDQLAGVCALEAADGMGRGLRTYRVHTGNGLEFDVLADRALDIAACRYQGTPLAWASPVGYVHPAHYEGEGLGWLRSFAGGLFTTCGLDQYGAPSVDGDETFGIHGRISNLAAQQVSHRAYWDGDDYRLEVSGEVRQARLFGENLVLRRRISTALGSHRIDVEDTVTNEGFNIQPHMILYHCNLGFPLIDETTELTLDAVETVARDADAEAGLATWRQFQPPTAGYREQVFRHRPQMDAEGKVKVQVTNPRLNFGLRICYDGRELPHLFQWKQMGQGAYVLGVEPANSSVVEGRAVAREREDLPQLHPGESCAYRLTFEVIPEIVRAEV